MGCARWGPDDRMFPTIFTDLYEGSRNLGRCQRGPASSPKKQMMALFVSTSTMKRAENASLALGSKILIAIDLWNIGAIILNNLRMQEQSPLKKGYAYHVLLFLHPYIEILELFGYKCCGKIALATKISLSPLFWMHAKISEVTSSAIKIFVILFHFISKFSPQKSGVK